MSNSDQPSTTENVDNKLSTLENLLEKATQSLRLPESDLPFGQAISWLTKAEFVAIEIGDGKIQTVADAYVELTLVACTKSQQLALNCGNILRQHRDLAIAIEASLRRLVGCRSKQASTKATLPSALLEAQGHAEQLVRMVSHHVKGNILYTDADLLSRLLSNLDEIRNLLFPLTTKVASDYRSDTQSLNLIGTALSNASASIYRWVNFLSDYEKASVCCRFAGQMVYDVDNRKEFVLGQVDRSSLERSIHLAGISLSQNDYKKSKFHLEAAIKILRKINAEF